MTGRDVMALALKIAGIYFLCGCITFVTQAGYLWPKPSGAYGFQTGLSFSLIAAVYLAAGLFLLIRGDRLAGRFFASSAPTERQWRVSRTELHEVAIAIAGLIILADAIPSILSQSATMLFFYLRRAALLGAPGSDFVISIVASFGGSVLKCILGLWLLFRSRGLVRFWESARGWTKGEA